MRSLGSRKELASLTEGDKVKDVVEGLWSPRSSENKGKTIDWPSKEVIFPDFLLFFSMY